METLYPIFLTIHLICAIIFLGYIFTDVILLTPLYKVLDHPTANKVFSTISKRGIKIMPLCLLLLILSGGAMVSRYIGSAHGFFTSNLQILLMLKIFFAACIFLMVIISLSCKFLKLKNPLAKLIHPIALILGFLIVILAKLAFYL